MKKGKHNALRYCKSRRGVLNHTRLKTGFFFKSDGDSGGLRSYNIFTLGAHRDSLSHSLSLSLCLSFSLCSLRSYSLFLTDYSFRHYRYKAHSRFRIGTTNQISFVCNCVVYMFRVDARVC